MEYIVTFKSTNHAIKAEHCLSKAKIKVSVAPLPAQIREGCGICLRLERDAIRQALSCLDENKIEGTRLFSRVAVQGSYVYDEISDIGGFMDTPQKLNSLLESCTSGGCGAKISPGELSKLLKGLPVFPDENLLVGFESSDDAAVYKLSDTHSIVTTADFFPPMVDDPATFGRIAAANALSDVYTMGARPLTALNLVCFPQSMDIAILKEILLGGAEKVAEASAVLCGGHSIYDKEPKYGLAVTGVVGNDEIIRNNTPETGHKLILTKPLGTGLIMSALRGGMVSAEAVDKAVWSMERLNRYAAEKAAGFRVSACTDITGFGLLAHALEMASDRASIVLYCEAIPYFEEAYRYADDYLMTAAGQRNRNHLAGKAEAGGLPFALQELLFDPQTSGGLLLCVAADQADDLLAAIREGDPPASIIGEVLPREKDVILFR